MDWKITFQWRKFENSLTSNLVQKLLDGFKVYKIYLKFNTLKSIWHLFLLSKNYITKSYLN